MRGCADPHKLPESLQQSQIAASGLTMLDRAGTVVEQFGGVAATEGVIADRRRIESSRDYTELLCKRVARSTSMSKKKSEQTADTLIICRHPTKATYGANECSNRGTIKVGDKMLCSIHARVAILEQERLEARQAEIARRESIERREKEMAGEYAKKLGIDPLSISCVIYSNGDMGFSFRVPAKKVENEVQA